MKVFRKVTIIGLVALLAACSGQNQVSNSAPSGNLVPTQVLSPAMTATLINTFTPTLTSTSTPTPSRTPTITKTPTSTNTPTPTETVYEMNTPIIADPLEITILEAWLDYDGFSFSLPGRRRYNFSPLDPTNTEQGRLLIVRLNVVQLQGEDIGMDHVRRDIYVQDQDDAKIQCSAIISGGLDDPKALTRGFEPTLQISTWPENYSLENIQGIVDYIFYILTEPNDSEDLVFYWGDLFKANLVLTEK